MLSGNKNKGSVTSSSSSSSSSPSSRHPLSVCGDCSSGNASWASVNRGILLCAECCSVHRSLGRHISLVKCLRGGALWIHEQLTMVQSLYSCGANSIWEYSLLNPAASSGSSASKVSRSSSLSGTSSGLSKDAHSQNVSKIKKPKPTDPLHPNKADFIRAKHAQLAFVYRPAKDEPLVTEVELSRQLHSSVRTPNLETSLRLLSQGADPNYFHTEKNSTPLQVAAKAGQACQVELLLVYGADPGAVDSQGKSAAGYAKLANQTGIANRLHSAQYEVSDRLSFFLCQKRPDHSAGQHFLLPELVDAQNRPEEAVVAKRRLQGLNNAVFEELALDVYDEVDRRETDAIWASLEGTANKSTIINMPFLPVNPDYSTTRNQGRQKLARLEMAEFKCLVLDVLKEIMRRQTEMMSSNWPKMPSPLRETSLSAARGMTKSLPMARTTSGLSDDEPIYDHVASDDDYYHIPDRNVAMKPRDSLIRKPVSVNSSPSKSSSNSGGFGFKKAPNLEYEQLRAQLENSEQKVQALMDSNDDIRSEIARLTAMVYKLVNENMQLRANNDSPTNSTVFRNSGTGSMSNVAVCSNVIPTVTGAPGSSSTITKSAPPPPLRTTTATPAAPAIYDQPIVNRSPLRSSGSPFSSINTRLPVSNLNRHPAPGLGNYYNSSSYNDYDSHNAALSRSVGGSSSGSLPAGNEYAMVSGGGHVVTGNVLNWPGVELLLPSQEEVVRRTEAITRCIQELLVSAKDEKFESFIPCSERIVRAVSDMVALFPSVQDPAFAALNPDQHPGIVSALSLLTAAAHHFETECRNLIVRSQKEPLNQGFVTQQVIQCAFDIAKSTKQLVALFQ